MIAAVAGGILLAGLTLYAALGGADFGGGLWDLLAGGDQRGRAPRQLIDDTITPVWEANHVWLILPAREVEGIHRVISGQTP
jgi:cytochrome d ubiquinol oxidase subunit II